MSEEKKKSGSESVYDADQIMALEGMEHVRMRPSMYIGDVNVRGLHHLAVSYTHLTLPTSDLV